MKHFTKSIFSILMVLFVFTSCTNEESIVDSQQNIEESESITTTLNLLSRQYDQNGNLNNDNPTGNVVFDFCFDFVYPLNLTLNNGTTITVNSLNDLVEVMMSSTEELYINGIAFLFNVETFNESTNAIEVLTINNEDEFEALLESCDFDETDDCFCTEEYDPVCVSITDSNGESFALLYPNACHAICDGFTEDDFSEECGEDYVIGGGECFEFVYPISVILDYGTPVTVNSREELFNATYGVYHVDLVLPLDIIIENDIVVTINGYNELEDVIEDCFGGVDFVIDCSIEDITNTLVDCLWQIDFIDFNEFIYNFNNDGSYEVVSDNNILTTGTWNILAGNDTFYISLNADSPDFNDEWMVTECDESLEMQSLIYPQAEIYTIYCDDDDDDDDDDEEDYDCSSEDGISNILSECPWIIDFIDFNEFIYTFNNDGSYEVGSDNNILTTGTWNFLLINNDLTINLNADLAVYNDTWLIVNCDEEGLTIESINYPQAEIDSIDCD